MMFMVVVLCDGVGYVIYYFVMLEDIMVWWVVEDELWWSELCWCMYLSMVSEIFYVFMLEYWFKFVL